MQAGNIPYQVYVADNFPLLKKPDLQIDAPINMLTESTNASPTPTVSELSWLALIPTIVAMLYTAIILQHRKNR